MDYSGITQSGREAMEEFAFDPVPLDEPTAPTTGRIADRLTDIVCDLRDAVEHGDLGAIVEATCEAERLCAALDAWGACMRGQHGRRKRDARLGAG